MRTKFVRPLLTAMFAISAALPLASTSAAIPCGTLPMIEPPENMAVPMIFIQLPVTLEAALARGMEADRTDSTPAENADSIVSAARNQFRCLGYGDSVAFATNSTPQQRVNMWAVPQVDSETTYIEIEGFYLEHLGEPLELADGRFLVDFGGIVDGKTYLTGELVFIENEGELYLDGSTIRESVELNEELVVVKIGLISTREIRLVPVRQGDVVFFENQEKEASATIVITSADGETVFEGSAMATDMVGGEDNPMFVINGLEPGDYLATITFDQDDITYTVTLIVQPDAEATPVASPASTPVS